MKNYFGPLKITHEWLGYSQDAPFEEKIRCIEARVKEIKSEGYTGIVTNVHRVNYLKNPEEWELMREKVRICKENEMRIWLYDEDGYPSGSAGGNTIAANRDFEARAAVMVSRLLKPGEEWNSVLPYGHEKPISAFGYYIEGESISDEDLSSDAMRPSYEDGFYFKNDSPSGRNLLCLAFYQKHMYEGGHCEHNCCSARRYFDISNRDAVKEFINNTYKRYADEVGEFFSPAIGDDGENSVIEAIFTDEPSYMGFYLNAALTAPDTVDKVDNDITLYPVVLWGRDFSNRFSSVKGYRIEDRMPALFLGDNADCRRVRRDFYQIASKLNEQSFFMQISDFCASAGLKFSGHILLEECPHDHVSFEGNFFKLLRHMHIPGIDFLHSIPETVWQFAFTPLLISSISNLFNKGHVMDEVSAHAQGGKVTIEQIYTSIMLQYALGADIFTSYYSENYPVEEQKKLWDAVSFAQSITQEKTDRSSTLLLYPIEAVMQLKKAPQGDVAEEDDVCGELLNQCETSMFSAMHTLLGKQIPFNFCDTDTLMLAQYRNPKAFIINASLIDDVLTAYARHLDYKGCRVIYYCDETEVPESSELYAEYSKIKPFAHLARTKEELVSLVNEVNGGAPTSGNTDGIAALWTDDGVLLVNSDSMSKEITLEKISASTASAIDVYTREPVVLSADADGKVKLTLAGYAAVAVKK